jgi:hypothetical protein
MQHSQRAVLVLILAVAVPAALRGQAMILEVEPDSPLAACEWKHRVTTCDMIHIDFVTTMSVGAAIGLDGRSYVLERIKPGYYLESGVILEAVDGEAPLLAGQRWREVHPQEGRIHVSRAWQDRDGNQALSPLDLLDFGSGRPLKVSDVRLLLWAREAPAQP